jgi:signal transduction histidine kinase
MPGVASSETEMFLAICAGFLATLVGLLFYLVRRKRRETAVVARALQSCVLWAWESDGGARVTWAQAGRRGPAWFDADALIGLPPWQLPSGTQATPPRMVEEALAAKVPFFDVPVSAQIPGSGRVTVWLSGIPVFRLGHYCGHTGTASLPTGPTPATTEAVNKRIAELEQLRVQDRIEQARQFELVAKELESFSYSVSHDLRSPLRVVDGFANILLEDYGARLDELGRDHLNRISAAANRMNAMIDALLAMSRRTGRELEIESVDLSRAARELADELMAGDVARGVDFQIEPDIMVKGDPVLLRLVLQNLLGNAFKFTTHAPQAQVHFGHCRIDGVETYFVRDNGAGFDMRFAERLFGLFQRLHSQNEFPGTGVGLATVQRIVRKHGGRVWAESEPGKGACFYFTLSAAKSTG